MLETKCFKEKRKAQKHQKQWWWAVSHGGLVSASADIQGKSIPGRGQSQRRHWRCAHLPRSRQVQSGWKRVSDGESSKSQKRTWGQHTKRIWETMGAPLKKFYAGTSIIRYTYQSCLLFFNNSNGRLWYPLLWITVFWELCCFLNNCIAFCCVNVTDFLTQPHLGCCHFWLLRQCHTACPCTYITAWVLLLNKFLDVELLDQKSS